MRVQPIVEGHGEALAVPILLRRLRDASAAFSLQVNRPVRASRSDLVREEPVRKALRRLLVQGNFDGILILLDGDNDCPLDLAAQILEWVRSEAGRIPCEVVVARREYEAWFLGSIESLRGHSGIREDAVSHPSPESVRGAKEKLAGTMARGKRGKKGKGYSETVDQPALTALFDLAAAHRSCRSFRRMVRAFGLLASAAGAEIGEWPPASWL